MPQHINPTDNGRTATAPYNFVPLPKGVFTVADGIEMNGKRISPWKMHDRFVPGTHSGWIDLSIETLTPLFIRGPVTKENGEWDQRDARLRPEPFTTPDGRPVIPGSSLRGMIRTLVEILSFSKLTPVTEEWAFFRTVASDRIGIAYRNRMTRGNKKPSGGYVRKDRDRWVIVPTTEVLRVHRNELNGLDLNIPDRPNPNYFPNWNGQHKSCWFKRDHQKNWRVAEICFNKKNDWEEGTLVLTGSAPKKKFDFVFAGREENRQIIIPDKIWRRFHDEDQLTQWQERAFPKDKPPQNGRKAKGHLRHGEPVFFLTEDSVKTDKNPDGLVFLGRAQMFRLPYDLSPLDLVPSGIKSSGLDMAQAIFGRVSQGKIEEDQTIKGRAYFEDAHATSGGPEWFIDEIIVPRILSSPKVTCFQHYLTQDGTKGQKDLTTYLQGDHTTIRGHKLYWHRWDDGRKLGAVKEGTNHDGLRNDLQSANSSDTQHTIIRPVKAGVAFSGRIRFDNLMDIELGALLSALRLPEGCAHKLGMGKPLGLGSVRIESKLILIDRTGRYSCWEDDGISGDDGGGFTKSFEETVLGHATSTQETIDETKHGLQKIARIDSLFHLLQWDGRPQISETDYIMDLKEFTSRRVLPTPHKVTGSEEPHWPSDRPTPAKQEADSHKSNAAKPEAKPTPTIQPTIPPPQAVKPVERGQARNGRLKRSGDRWVAVFEGDPREAVIVNPDKIPKEAATEDRSAEFYITEQSKKAGIKARLERLV